MSSLFWLGFFLVLLLVVTLAGTALAQELPPSDDEVNAVAKGLYCPVCENIPLDVCPTQACVQWRELIREKLAQGWNEVQIQNYFVQQYGDRVLAQPPPRGLNWLVYLIPPIAVLGGIYVVYRAMRAWWAPAPQSAGTSVVSGVAADEYEARLEEELRRRQ